MTNYTKKAIRGSTMVFLMAAFTSVISYVSRIVFARNLSPSDYGLFYAVFTLIMFLLIFRDLGLGSALTKFIAEYNVKKNYSKIKTLMVSAFTFQIISSSLLVLVLVLLSKTLAANYFKAEIASKVLSTLTLYILITVFLRLFSNTLNGFQKSRWYSLTEPLRQGFALLLSWLYFRLDFGIMAPVLGFVTAALLASFVLFIGFSKYMFIFKYKMKNFWGATKQLFKFGLPLIFTGMGSSIISHTDVLMLTYFASLETVGIYNVILPTAMTLVVFGTAVSMVIFPMISELWARKDKIRASEGVRMVYIYSFVLLTPILFGIFAFSDLVIDILFGAQYATGMAAFKILLVGILFQTVATINVSALSGIGKPIIVTKITIVAALVSVILNILLIPTFKLTGAAIATSVSYLILLLSSTSQLSHFMEISPPWKNWIKTFFAGGCFVLAILVIRSIVTLSVWPKTIISVLSAGLIYIAMIFWFRVVEIKEVKVLVNRLL